MFFLTQTVQCPNYSKIPATRYVFFSSLLVMAFLAGSALAACGGGGGGTIGPPPMQLSSSPPHLGASPVALVNPPPSQPSPGILGQTYSLDLTQYVHGGTLPYSWSIKSGSLPAGLTLNSSTGIVAGIPTGTSAATRYRAQITTTSVATIVIVFTCTDSGPLPTSADVVISLTLSPARALQVITFSNPPPGVVGMRYGTVQSGYTGFALRAAGGVPAYTWSWAAQAGSSLPPGLNITVITIGGGVRCCTLIPVIEGTPTLAGTYQVTVKVTDAESPPDSATANYTIPITTR